jgi:hypothetical protein
MYQLLLKFYSIKKAEQSTFCAPNSLVAKTATELNLQFLYIHCIHLDIGNSEILAIEDIMMMIIGFYSSCRHLVPNFLSI